MDNADLEVPGSSPKKKRGPQTRDIIAAVYAKEQGIKKSGKTWDRIMAVDTKVRELDALGCMAEARVLADAMDVSQRGAYEIARMADDVILSLCQVVISGEARNLIEAHRIVKRIIKKNNCEDEEPIILSRAKNGMYRLNSGHNKASVLLSAQDLLELGEIIQSNIGELQEKASEVPRTSPEE